jgi:hypothetical protein
MSMLTSARRSHAHWMGYFTRYHAIISSYAHELSIIPDRPYRLDSIMWTLVRTVPADRYVSNHMELKNNNLRRNGMC